MDERCKMVLTPSEARAFYDRFGFPIPDSSVDRVISTYVLDLLADTDIRAFLREAHRAQTVGGNLCLVSLNYMMRKPENVLHDEHQHV
jgi:ubiquinone/menaquinone biosynthesis C-methylase UbiE